MLPLITNNSLTGDRGTQNNDQPDRRQPWQVIDAMRQTTRGIRQLGKVLAEQAEGKKAFHAVDAAGNKVVGNDAGRPVLLGDVYLREEYPDADRVPTPRVSGDQPRDIFEARKHELQVVVDRLLVARDQVKSCRDADGTLFAERIGVDYRACKTWLDAIHSIAKDLAVWEQADIKYNGRRHDDDAQEDDVDEDVMEVGEDDLDDDEL